jgi:hypothetical protein
VIERRDRMNVEERAAIRERLERSTEGKWIPWAGHGAIGGPTDWPIARDDAPCENGQPTEWIGHFSNHHDQAFAVYAHEDVPRLLDALDQAVEREGETKAALESIWGQWTTGNVSTERAMAAIHELIWGEARGE